MAVGSVHPSTLSNPHLRLYAAALHAPVAREYGVCECGIMATDAPDGSLRVREDHVLIETLPRDGGRYGIVVTGFNNTAFPLIRYDIGDVTSGQLGRSERGIQFSRMYAGATMTYMTY